VRRRGITAAAVLVAIVLLGAWFLRPDSPAAPSSSAPAATSPTSGTPTVTPTVTKSPTPTAEATTKRPHPSASPTAAALNCDHPATAAFTPQRISIPHVTGGARVLALGYDARGVPGVPPLTSEGKTEFAWVPEVHPGASRGNVLLNAHTWPDGTALGNHLLAGLDTGGRIAVVGSGEVLCYRVTDRVEVAATASVPAYFDADGQPQLAIIVCSGIRRGPGDWTERTIWYASPQV